METGANTMVSELTQGFKRARELEAQLSTASTELCKSLVREILASFDKAMSMAKSSGCPNSAIGGTDSLRSFTGSPRSESSEQPLKAERKETVCKKRKTQPNWTSLKLGSGPDAEGPLDDGHSWRKYGQKEILGAKHPRGYYRCTHRNSQGCLAMKQVQLSDGNQEIFEVAYRGTHTCRPKPVPSAGAAAASSFPNIDYHNNQLLLPSFQTNLKVETENLHSQFQDPAASSSFSFPSTPIDGVKPDSHVFSPASTLDNCFKRSFTDAFISPATSESNYFSSSPRTMSSYGGGPCLQASEFDVTEIVSAATPVSPSLMSDLDFLLQSSELDTQFPLFDTWSFLS